MFDWFKDTFFKQFRLQKKIKMTDSNNLADCVDMYGAATGMIIEIGEMLQQDTRWKKRITGSVKKPIYNEQNFIEELADTYIYLMNVIIYAGIDIDVFKNQVTNKQLKVEERYENDKKYSNRRTE